MTLEDAKKLLDRGDYVKIARMAGYSDLTEGRKYVYKVLSRRIKGTRGKSKDIIEATLIIAQRNADNGKIAEQ